MLTSGLKYNYLNEMTIYTDHAKHDTEGEREFIQIGPSGDEYDQLIYIQISLQGLCLLFII